MQQISYVKSTIAIIAFIISMSACTNYSLETYEEPIIIYKSPEELCKERAQIRNIILPNNCVDSKDYCIEVVLTNSLNKEWKISIIDAFDAWHKILGTQLSYKFIESNSPSDSNNQYFFTWLAVNNDDLIGYAAFTSDTQVKVTDVKCDLKLPVAIHEAGHLLGLGHTPKHIPSIMHEVLDVFEIMCEDEKNICALWSCEPSNKCQYL